MFLQQGLLNAFRRLQTVVVQKNSQNLANNEMALEHN